MNLRVRLLLVSMLIWSASSRVEAQAPASPMPGGEAPKSQLPPPPPATAVAAQVNGQDIPELAVYRAFMHDPASYNAENRKDLINHLVDNMLVDQYLSQLKIPVEPKEIDARLVQISAEAAKTKNSLGDMLAKMHLTEDDLRKELLGALRWEKFLAQQANDKVLQELFDKNPTMFNGTRVVARHILIPNKGPESLEHIKALKKWIEDNTAAEVAKLPSTTDPQTRETERTALLVKLFAKVAEDRSTCPSKAKGGELGAFPRVGAMVEPFARTAFALKPYEMSDPVATEFGYHIILCVEIRPGREVTFAEVRPFVQEVYGDRLREAVIAAYKPRSKIVIQDAK